MSNKIKILVALSLTVCAAILSGWTSAETNVLNYIEWDEARKLTWTDFKGKINSLSNADAATAVHISAKPFHKKKKLYYEVNAYFIPSQSWCRNTSAKLLRHEQLHFDIAELYARKARKKISEFSQMGIRNVDEYNRAVTRILQESNKADMEYDMSTFHGARSAKQLEWEKEVSLELSILNRFSKENWK